MNSIDWVNPTRKNTGLFYFQGGSAARVTHVFGKENVIMGLFKRNVYKMIERMVEKKDVGGLVKALDDKNQDVRLAAAKALAKTKEWHEWEPVLAGLRTWHHNVPRLRSLHASQVLTHKAISDASGKFNPSLAVERLCVVLSSDESEDVRRAAALSLGEIGDVRALEPLLNALRGGSEWMRRVASSSLGKMGPPQAIQALITLLGDADEEIRAHAVSGLKYARFPSDVEANRAALRSAVDPLCAALRSGDSRLRTVAIETLGRIRDTRAVEPLCAALKDKDVTVRQAAVKALSEMPDDVRTIQPLKEALDDSDIVVRSYAKSALSRKKQ